MVDSMSLENDLFRKYPKMALQGKELDTVLDTEWKKAFVSFVASGIINIEIQKKTLILGNQLSDGFDEIMKKELPVKMDSKSEAELKIVYRIKNYLVASHEVIVPFIKQNDAILLASKKRTDEELEKKKQMPEGFVMNPGLYDYYVPAKATLLAAQDENMVLVNGIIDTIPKCFAEAIKSGFDFKGLEASAIEGTNTREELRTIFAKVVQSTGINIKV